MRPRSDDRLARALKRLRWPVLIAWILLVVALSPFANRLSGATNNGVSAYLPAAAQSTRVVLLQQAAQRGAPDSDPATVVFAANSALTPHDLAAVSAARGAVAALTGRVSGLGAPTPVVRSADGRAAVFSVDVTATPDTQTATDSAAVKAVDAAVDGQSTTGLQVAVTGSAVVNADTAIQDQSLLLLRALLIVAVILLLVYRSPTLWLLPLIGAVGAIEVAKAAAYGLAEAGLTVSSLSTSILTVLVLGAASDYALLLCHRYREELRRHAATEDAMAAALRRTLPTLLASAATVTIGMICLLAAESASLHGLGPIGAVSIVIALVAETTLLPSLLLICGRVVFWPRVPRPGDGGREESRVWSAVGARVARHPAYVIVATLLVLGAASVGLGALRTTGDPVATVKGHPGAALGERLLDRHFPGGDLAPLTVLTPPGLARAAATAARSAPDVAGVSPAAPVGGHANLTVTLSVPPYGSAAGTAVAGLRDRLDHAAPGSLVGGDPAVQYDIGRAAHRDDLLLIPLVFVVILVIVGVLLRAVVAPLLLIATTAAGFGAAFGLAGLLWRYAFGYAGIEAQLPLYIFIFLVALGIDYNIFLSARIREEAGSLGTREGTLRGLSVTGGVISAAALIMAGTFGALSTLPQVPIAEVGTAVVVGVLLDALLVRTVLVPAGLVAIGDRVWWPGSAARADRR